MKYYSILVAALLPAATFAQSGVVGKAPGFASEVTGGGSATPAAPSDVDELKEWLTDDTPRVILIDKEFNFIGTEGSTTTQGCRPDSNTCVGNGGQDAIDSANWCSASYPSVTVTYDNAAIEPINVAGDKSIIGVGDAGVLRGKGLRMANGAQNVLIQNIHITELNPQYIWGGDAITLVGTDLIWIDHCKFSLIGRQMLVTGYDPAGRVTISNNEFDGETSWSASCNHDHYWTMLFYGEADQITLSNNYIHNCSGRAPKIGSTGSVTFRAVNNYFTQIGGHDFDVGEGANVLIEGNVFENVTTPITSQTASAGGHLFNVPTFSDADTCQAYLDRSCEVNSVTGSGDFADYIDKGAFTRFSNASDIVTAMPASQVASSVVKTAGIGKLSSSSSSLSSTSSSNATSSSNSTSSLNSMVAAGDKVVTLAAAFDKNGTIVNAPAANSTAAPVANTTSGGGITTAPASGGIAKYFQCGGANFFASGSCQSGTTCVKQNEYYSQCL